jgi:hypothetical protein
MNGVEVLNLDRIIKVDREMLKKAPGLVLKLGGEEFVILFTEKEKQASQMSGNLVMKGSAFDKKEAVSEPKKRYAPEPTRASTSLGKKIKAKREASGLSCGAFAKKGGINKSRLYLLETGKFVNITAQVEKALKKWGVAAPPDQSSLWP